MAIGMGTHAGRRGLRQGLALDFGRSRHPVPKCRSGQPGRHPAPPGGGAGVGTESGVRSTTRLAPAQAKLARVAQAGCDPGSRADAAADGQDDVRHGDGTPFGNAGSRAGQAHGGLSGRVASRTNQAALQRRRRAGGGDRTHARTWINSGMGDPGPAVSGRAIPQKQSYWDESKPSSLGMAEIALSQAILCNASSGRLRRSATHCAMRGSSAGVLRPCGWPSARCSAVR